MRITRNMINDRVQWNLSRILRNFGKLQDQLSSGVRVQYPSDDSVMAFRVSNFNARLREFKQQERDIDTARNHVGYFDSALQEYSSVLHRVKELMVRASTGTMSEADRKAIMEELERIKEHIATIANTKVGGKYLFGGTSSDIPPVVKDEDGRYKVVLTPDTRNLKIDVFGRNIEYTILAGELFITKSGDSVFDAIDRMVQHLRSPEEAGTLLNTVDIEAVDKALNTVMEAFAKIGAVSRILDFASDRLKDLDVYTTEVLSKEQDTDITEVVSKLAMKQATLQAALKSAAQVMQPSLLDFLR